MPPARGIIPANSPQLKAPINVSAPVTTHTASSQPADPTCREISAETIKMPESLIDPATNHYGIEQSQALNKGVAGTS